MTSPAGAPGPRPGRTPARRVAAGEAPSRPRLRVVPAPRRRAPRAPFVVLIIALLGGALLSVLVVNTQRAQDAFTLTSLQKHNAQLSDQMQTLRAEVQKDQTPATIASRAAAIGMVAGSDPVFVDPTGKILGVGASGTVDLAAGQRFGDSIVIGKAIIRKPTPTPAAAAPVASTTPGATAGATAAPTAVPSAGPATGTQPAPSAGAVATPALTPTAAATGAGTVARP